MKNKKSLRSRKATKRKDTCKKSFLLNKNTNYFYCKYQITKILNYQFGAFISLNILKYFFQKPPKILVFGFTNNKTIYYQYNSLNNLTSSLGTNKIILILPRIKKDTINRSKLLSFFSTF